LLIKTIPASKKEKKEGEEEKEDDALIDVILTMVDYVFTTTPGANMVKINTGERIAYLDSPWSVEETMRKLEEALKEAEEEKRRKHVANNL
jgi:hypothetical protein